MLGIFFNEPYRDIPEMFHVVHLHQYTVFSIILYYADGLATFRNFLRSEFSEENIEFWLACEDFKKTKSPLKMATKAKKIYEDFIQTGGNKEVGLFHSFFFFIQTPTDDDVLVLLCSPLKRPIRGAVCELSIKEKEFV